MNLLQLARAAATTPPPDGAYLTWGFILAGIALVVLIIELFVPSGGLLGILCGLAAIGSIVSFFLYDTAWGVGVTLAFIVLTPFLLVFVFKLWLNSPVAKAMILGTGDPTNTDIEEAARQSETARQQRLEVLRALVGAEGRTETALRPVGTVRINDVRTDAMAEAGVIEANTPVVVTEVYDNQIKVRPL